MSCQARTKFIHKLYDEPPHVSLGLAWQRSRNMLQHMVKDIAGPPRVEEVDVGNDMPQHMVEEVRVGNMP